MRWRGWFDSRGRFQWPWEPRTWRTWEPPDPPNVDALLWTDAPWTRPVGDTPVDQAATDLLHSPEWDAPVRTAVDGMSYQNVYGGSPWQDVTGYDVCIVWETGEAQNADLMPWVWKRHLVPLPPVVRRYNDPTGRQDNQWIGVDRTAQLMWECGAMRPRVGAGPNEWVARSVSVWDLTKPWDEASPKGVTASNLPLLAGIPRYEEFVRGRIDHALWFVADRYSPNEIRWPARGTDGLYPDSPLVAGMRLQLDPEWEPGFTPTPQQEVVITAAKEFGFYVTDRTEPEQGSKVREAMDARIHYEDLGIRHSDLIVLAGSA